MITPSCRNHQNPRSHHVTRALGGRENSGWVGGSIIPLWRPTQKLSSEKQGNTKPGSLVCQVDREKKKKQNTKIFQDKYMAPILEASSKSWINCCQQWHNLPGTSVGLVSSQLSFEEGIVQGKRKKFSSHHTQLPFSLQNNWPRQFPHSSRLGTSKEPLTQQVPVCSWKRLAVVATG